MALDDSIHGNLSEGNAQVCWGKLSSHISNPSPAPATVSEAHTQLQILMWSSETKLIVKQVFNLLWGNVTLQGLKPGWAFHTPPHWPGQCLAFGMPHSTRVDITNPQGMNFAKWLQLDIKIVQKKGTVHGDKLSFYWRMQALFNQRARINGPDMETSTFHSRQFSSFHWVVLDMSLKLFLPCLIRRREEQWPFIAVASFDPRLECTLAAFLSSIRCQRTAVSKQCTDRTAQLFKAGEGQLEKISKVFKRKEI